MARRLFLVLKVASYLALGLNLSAIAMISIAQVSNCSPSYDEPFAACIGSLGVFILFMSLLTVLPLLLAVLGLVFLCVGVMLFVLRRLKPFG